MGMDYLRIPETSLGAGRLSDSQEKTTKRLAELKSYLEKKVAEHQNEIQDLQSFLVGKVLEPLHVKDEESTRKQGLSPDHVLSYEIDREANALKQIHVKNYGDERRLNELKNALRWTFRRMYEKTIGTQ